MQLTESNVLQHQKIASTLMYLLPRLSRPMALRSVPLWLLSTAVDLSSDVPRNMGTLEFVEIWFLKFYRILPKILINFALLIDYLICYL